MMKLENPLVVIAVVAALSALATIAMLVGASVLRNKRMGYVASPSLVTPTERRFMAVLDNVARSRWRVFSKVRMEDIICVPRNTPAKLRNSMRGRIKSRHIDFVLCDPSSMAFLCALELDDRSHERESVKERDAFVNEAFSNAGIPLLRIPACKQYDANALNVQIEQAIAAKP